MSSPVRAPRAAALLMCLGATAAWSAPSPISAGAERIVDRTLANGMKIVVWPDEDIPNVALYTFFKVGSRNEHAGITGISHYFEHMMFNGTKTRKQGDFDRIMEASGGSNNASTSSDVTIYQDWFPASALDTVLDLEADRMRNLDFDAQVVESERGVVYSERRSRIDNDSFGTLVEQVQAAAFVAHPYEIPTVGWPSDIESWKIEDLRSFYQRYYAPNNAVMFVVGAVTPDEVFRLADKHFAAIPSQPAPRAVTIREPEQLGERRIRIERESQTPWLAMAWHAFSGKDRETRVMEVLMAILGDGDSSRLHQRLVEKERAAVDLGTAIDQGFDPGLAWIYAIVPPGGDARRTERLIDEEIARLAKDGPTPAELVKARNQALVSFWRGLETIAGKAEALGRYEVFHGDYHLLFAAPSVYASITAEDVKTLAATVLRTTNRTVGLLESPPDAAAPRETEANPQERKP
jgi:zinc protease